MKVTATGEIIEVVQCGIARDCYVDKATDVHHDLADLSPFVEATTPASKPHATTGVETPRTEPYCGRWATYYHNGVTIYDHARQLECDLTAAQLQIDRLKAALLWCVEVLESQRYEMDNEGNISTHVAEGKLEELQAIVANQHKEQKS